MRAGVRNLRRRGDDDMAMAMGGRASSTRAENPWVSLPGREHDFPASRRNNEIVDGLKSERRSSRIIFAALSQTAARSSSCLRARFNARAFKPRSLDRATRSYRKKRSDKEELGYTSDGGRSRLGGHRGPDRVAAKFDPLLFVLKT